MKRLVLKRLPQTVPCTYIDSERPELGLRSCGEMIPFRVSGKCPACGQRQKRALATEPPAGARIIHDNALIVDEDSQEIVAVQILGETTLAARIGQSLRRFRGWTDMTKNLTSQSRMSGIAVGHTTFGFSAPAPLRRRYACSRCNFDTMFPEIASLVYGYVETAERKFRQHAPDAYAHTAQAVMGAVKPAWLIKGTPWTSGIINNTAALPYHMDSGNIAGSWSAMLSARNDIEGGYLHLVDYDVYLAVPHGSISIFDGQSVLHGVTPFQISGGDPYRFTLVCYAKSGMKVCSADPKDEPKRGSLHAQRLAEAKFES